MSNELKLADSQKNAILERVAECLANDCYDFAVTIGGVTICFGKFADVYEERDRLRDIVRRLARVADDTLKFAEVMCGIVPDNPERAKARSEIEALLREARAALGEDTK